MQSFETTVTFFEKFLQTLFYTGQTLLPPLPVRRPERVAQRDLRQEWTG